MIKKKKFYKKTKEIIGLVKDSLKSFGYKRIVLIVIGVILLFVIMASFFKKSSFNTYYDAKELSYKESNYAMKKMYSTYKKNKTDANVILEIPLINMVGSSVDINSEYREYLEAYQEKVATDKVFVLSNSTDYIKPEITITKAGMYYLRVDYLDLNEQINDNQIEILVNDNYPYLESRTIKLPSTFYFESDEFRKDRYKNEIQPSSYKDRTWKSTPIKDYEGLHPGYFGFYLKPGDELTIKHNSGKALIGQISFILNEKLISYEEYISNYINAEEKSYYEVSAREIYSRTSASIRLYAERDPSSSYYHTQYLILNTISGDSWLNGGEAITYKVNVEKAGLYNLAFKYKQNQIKDMSVYRKIYINGEVPYAELESFAFPYTTDFVNRKLKNQNGDMFVYLKEGENEITLEVVNYPNRNAIHSLRYVMNEIQSLSLAIKKYTAGGTDKYRDWDIEEYFPDAEEALLGWAALLDEVYREMLVVSTNKQPTEISNLKVASTRLKRLAKNINKLPSKMVQFSDGDSSVSQLLGDLMQRLMRSQMNLEKLAVMQNKKMKKPHTNIFNSVWEGTKRLVLSYINNPYKVQGRKEGELIVWVNHPRQYIEIMQTLIDAEYDGELNITLSQMPDENKLILANTSGQSPDVAIGVNHWLPYEFSIRNASLDLRKFEGFEEIVSKMTPGAFIPMVFEDGVYGLPETQNFWVTYYRIDILESIGINHIPQTWEEIIEILPILQSYGMNYFLPLAQYEGLKPFVATLPFIYQFGGDLYKADGMETAINSEETIVGMKMMTDLFTLYNLPQRVGSFYNDFRYGKLPIGVSDLSMYLLLSNAAVELDGLWHMDLHPGYEIEGVINRYAPVGGQTSMILSNTKYPKEAFHFLKWWMETETQKEFQFKLETTYGKQYFWNSANVEAFMASSIPSEFKEIIKQQWKHGIEAARIPGTYMVERTISNAWSEIVYNGSNPRLSMDSAVRISNREIKYKMTEFGYVKDNEVVKPYRVPSIYNIHEWLTEVPND